jgi:parallel beta-helix repeat protein
MSRVAFRRPTAEWLEPRLLLTTYYVSPGGDDAVPGTSDAHPFATLQRAADVAVAGDTVNVRAGTYPAGMNFFGKAGGVSGEPIQFLADPGVVITHCATAGVNAGLAAINVENSGGLYVIRGFTINSDGSIERAGIRVANADHVQLLENTVDRAYIGIFASNCDGLVLQGNTCRNSTDQHGIYVGANTRNALVRGNRLYGNTWDGLHMNAVFGAPNDSALVEDNVIYGNNLSGMDIEGVTHAAFRNNLVYGNSKHGITLHNLDQARTPSAAGNVFVNNTVAANGMFAIQMEAGGNTANTLFNNVLVSTSSVYGSIGIRGEPTGLVSDYNAVSDAFSTDVGVSKLTLEQWRTATLQDQHSTFAPADQLFRDPDAADFHLRPGAVAVDAGIQTLNDITAPAYDLDGNTRPRGPAWDAGAYEDISIPDVLPPVLSAVAVTELHRTWATITWTTHEVADAQIEFGMTPDYGNTSSLDPALRITHAVTITGLVLDTTYHYRILSRDAAGNLGASEDLTFTTPPPDLDSPILSDIAPVDITVTSAKIGWHSDEPADTQVEYGSSTDYGTLTDLQPALGTDHLVTLTGLQPATTYHYRLRSRDESGNLAVSQDFTFTTVTPGQLPAGALAFWRFDETQGDSFNDASGNGNTGTPINGPAHVSARDPSRGNAISFDGTDDQVRITRTPTLEPEKITLAAWVKLAVGISQAKWATIVKKSYADDSPPIFSSYYLGFSPDSPNVLSFFTGHANGADDQLDAPAPLPTGQWIHVAATYDPAAGQKILYVNGLPVASRSLKRPIEYDTTKAGDLYLGHDAGPGEVLAGALDDVGIWDRALSPSDVQILAYGVFSPVRAPTGLGATVLSAGHVHLNWADPSMEHLGYMVVRGTDDSNWKQVAFVAPDARSFDDLTAFPGKAYRYRVYACDDVNSSDPSNLAFAVTWGGGNGLRGDYFPGPDFTGTPAVSRTDPAINFDWKGGAPADGITPGVFSVRWTGQVQPFETGQYAFYTAAHGAVRLWVNGQLLIDRSTDFRLNGDVNDDGTVDSLDFQALCANFEKTGGAAQGDLNADGQVDFADFQLLELAFGDTLTASSDAAALSLQAGVKYQIAMEFVQTSGPASANLEWLTPSGVRQVVPVAQLFAASPTLSAAAPPTPAATITLSSVFSSTPISAPRPHNQLPPQHRAPLQGLAIPAHQTRVAKPKRRLHLVDKPGVA